MTIGLIISTIINLIFAYIIFNLLRKFEAVETELESYQVFFGALHTAAVTMLDQMRQIDLRGSFEADDEVGVLYKGMRMIILQLEHFFEIKGIKNDNQAASS